MEIDKILEAAYPYIEWIGIEDSQFRLFALLALSLIVVVILFFVREKAGYKLFVFICLLVGIVGVGYFVLVAEEPNGEVSIDDEWLHAAAAFSERCNSRDLDDHREAVSRVFDEYKPIVEVISANNGQVLFGEQGDYPRDIALNPLQVAATNVFFSGAGGVMQVACIPNTQCAAPVRDDKSAPIFVFQNSDCAFAASELLARAVNPSAPLENWLLGSGQ